MRMMKRLLIGLLVALAGCEPDVLQTVLEPSGDKLGYAEIPVCLDVEAGEPDTKAPSLSGADDAKRGGVLFLVYRSSTKQLDSYRFFTPEELAAAASQPLKVRVPLAECDIYVLGNLLAVSRKDASKTADLVKAFGADFPADEAALEAMAYRLDGGSINADWRREKMAEVAKYGIPYSYVDKNVPVESLLSAGKSVPRGRPTWMFSRVEVTIDHGLFDGGDPAKVGYFTNKTLKMKQANLRLRPFSAAAMKAEAAADAGDGDLDPSMTNGTSNTYVFHVPENMQGTAPEAAFAAEPDASKKNRLKVPSNTLIPANCRNYGTYVEFKGKLDKNAGGFGGDVTYQFYLGANETTDFNLQRGRRYKIRLKFTADGLFHPDWRVQAELTDARLFRLTADPAFARDIGEVNAGRTLAVRCNRPGALYVYMNPGGKLGGTNLLLGKDVQLPADFAMADLADCAWYGACMTAGSEDAKWLAARGITPVWEKAAARLKFSVTDAAKFRAHVGESRSFSLTLLPGATQTVSFTLKLFSDITLSVADGKSLTDEFYLGQKRTVTLSGFAGRTVKYAAVQEGCGASANTRKTSNVQWKATNSSSAAFPSCAVDAAGNVLLDVSDKAYASQNCTGTLNVYAFYPNRFQGSHGGWSSKNGKIVFFSEDFLNDSLEVPVRISEPRINLWAPAGKSYPWYYEYMSGLTGGAGIQVDKVPNGSKDAPVILNIDGTERKFDSVVYLSFSGAASLPKASFDATLYDRLLKVSVARGTTVSGKAWLLDAVQTDGYSCIYIGDTKPSGNPLESVATDTYMPENFQVGAGGRVRPIQSKDQVTLGSMILQSNPATGLFGQTSEFWVAATRMSDISIRYGLSTSCFGWYAKDDGSSVSRYFMLLESADGRNTDRMEMDISSSFRGGDVTRLQYDMSGPKVTYTVGSQVIGPVIDYEWKSETSFKWIFDASRQVTQYAGQFVPGELLVPYGEQLFTVSYSNKWDHRTFSVSRGMKLVYDISLYALYAFSPAAGKVFVVPHRNADLLARKGASMSQAARAFCLEAAGVNFGRYFYVNPTAGYDAGYYAASSDANRGAYSASNPYVSAVTFNGATVPMKLYRSRMTSWTESAARDFCWTTYAPSTGVPSWRYFLNWGGFEWLKNPLDHIGISYPEAQKLGFDDRFGSISISSISDYLNGTTKLNTSYSRTYSSADAGYVDIVRYFLWLGNQQW